MPPPAMNASGSASGSGDQLVQPIVSPVTGSVAPVVVPSRIAPTQAQAKLGLSTPVIAAAGGGGFLVLALLLLLVFCCYRKRRRDKTTDAAASVNAALSPKLDEWNGIAYADLSPAGTAELTATTNSILGGIPLHSYRIDMAAIRRGTTSVGRGGFGEVYRGEYQGRDVAIKQLLREKRRDSDEIGKFKAEIIRTAALSHPHIPKFVGAAWTTKNDLGMVTEFIPGGDLRTYMRTTYRPGNPAGFTPEKLKIARQIAEVLVYLHGLATPVVHRALKSLNVLLTFSGDAKVIDFGVATESHDSMLTTGVGTSLWMAPEVMLSGKYNEKADIFSFGVLLSELDTHQIPYSQITTVSGGDKTPSLPLLNHIARGEITPQFTVDADPTMKKLAEDCLSTKPKDRPTATELLARLAGFIRYQAAQNTTNSSTASRTMGNGRPSLQTTTMTPSTRWR